MSPRSAPRATRRSFFKFSAAALAGVLALRLPPPPSLSGVRLASALPGLGWPLLPSPEHLLNSTSTAAQSIDAALVPAYVAAMLIQAGRLQPLAGPAGRPHDPEGHYTFPFAQRVAVLRYPVAGNGAAPRRASWADLWVAADGAVWPAFGRVLTGVALLRRGYSPNDTHAGHLARAAADLQQLRSMGARQSVQAADRLQLVLADPADLRLGSGLRLPVEGTILIEYDWVITAGPAGAAAARQFIAGLSPLASAQHANWPVRLIPLMPLPLAAHAQHRAIQADLAG